MSRYSRLAAAAERARARRTGELVSDVALFAGLLRDCGAAVSPSSPLSATRALAEIEVVRRYDFRCALTCTLVSSLADTKIFDSVFDIFWSPDDNVALVTASTGGGEQAAGETSAGNSPPGGSTLRDRVRSAPLTRSVHRAVHSHERGGRGSIASVDDAQIDALVRELSRTFGSLPGRRRVAGTKGELVDLRGSVRANFAFGGELLRLQRLEIRRDRARLLVLCDISASMQAYTPLFLAFVHALTRRVRRVEAAVFNVEPLLVSDVFRRCDRRRALAWLGRQEAALAGGTRIGHSIAGFLDEVERTPAAPAHTVALVLSDGWDVGERDLLVRQMRRLRESAHRVIWCDPHAAAANYRPEVAGLRNALPLCDAYLDFSSAESLRTVAQTIAATGRVAA
ncbi:MAG TPA: VWA domain-containing protein [Mycobacteriales bacterium]|nr:VWA domain-containing protein [Mycobacteriales bacterium]